MTALRAVRVSAAVDDAERMVTVAEVNMVGRQVKEFVLTAPNEQALPSYTPGSHIVVDAGGHANAYSLTGVGVRPGRYRISVLRRGDDGGSAWLHSQVQPGTKLRIVGPRSAFAPVLAARKHLLIAGGIGITPILSHARAARLWGRDFTVFYAHSAGAEAPHLQEIATLAEGNFIEATGRKQVAETLYQTMRRQPLGTFAYLCGPEGLLELYREIGAELGWPEDRLRREHFQAPELDPGEPFTVRLNSSHRTVSVPSGVSLLDALEAGGTYVPRMCRQGVCGQCRVAIVSGSAVHRDVLQTSAEKTANEALYCCVSRGVADELVLDL